MTISKRPKDGPEALSEIVSASTEEKVSTIPRPPEGLPGDDDRDNLPFAFNERCSDN